MEWNGTEQLSHASSSVLHHRSLNLLHVTVFLVTMVRIKDAINGLVCKRGKPSPERTNLPKAHQGGQILLKTVVVMTKQKIT